MMGVETEKTLRIVEIVPEESMAESHFFNSKEFFQGKSFPVKGWQLVREHPLAQIFFSVQEATAISGYMATFGSFDIASEIKKEELQMFIASVLVALKAQGVEEVVIRHYPDYFKHADLVSDVLDASGFEVLINETNQHIPVSDRLFTELAKRNKLKKIRQCLEHGYEMRIETISGLPEIYRLVKTTRERKAYPVSMTYGELFRAISNAPGRYLLFALYDSNQLIAASVTVIIAQDVLYNFYHADAVEYRSNSPLSFLVNKIYEYAQQNGFKILDLGISSDNGRLNKGLFTFKQNLGAVVTNKSVYRLKLN